jgi:hypothetical protein
MRRPVVLLLSGALALGACSDDGPQPATATTTTAAAAAEATTTTAPEELWEPACPTGFEPHAGLNTGFESDGLDREFHLLLPDDVASARPVFVSLTGTVQEEEAFLAQSELDQLTDDGWIVLAPVRLEQPDGRVWPPWYDGHPDPADEGPDVRFLQAAVECTATAFPVDQRAVYVGGISAGGSLTNRVLTYDSAFFAGGVPSSGNWYPVGGGPDGLCCPRPLPTMDPAIVIVIWGGPTDIWPPGDSPLAVYAPETKLASEYYASQPEVVTVSCSGTHGHIWPATMTRWLAETLLSHPKGTEPDAYELTEPAAGFSCVLGAFTDH